MAYPLAIHGRFATKTARTKCNGFGKSKELAPYEAILAPYEGMLAPFEAMLAPCEPILGSCWAYVGPILTHFWPVLAQIKNFDPF